jgi:hypothetical protein
VRYKLPVIVVGLEDGAYMARCEQVRATATGNTAQAAVDHLRKAIEDMVRQFGEDSVFRDVQPESDVQVIEVAV